MSAPPPVGIAAPALDAAGLRDAVEALFRSRRGVGRVGLEVEALPVSVDTRRSVGPWGGGPDGTGVIPGLRRWAAARGVVEGRSAAGVPGFHTPEGGVLSFEPGGQLEYASPPHAALDRLAEDVEEVLRSVARELRADGIRLVARGVDPWNVLSDAPLHVDGRRYRRMAAHYARRGPLGARMMRQSAAVHVNVDAPGPAGEAWWVASAAAPALLAAFANSPRAEGRDTGHRSTRASLWRGLDPARTGLPGASATPWSDYVAFALDAPAFLMGDDDEPARPFRSWLGRATREDWVDHLSTLFPEVRPRGYVEIRSVDALPLDLVPLPAVTAAGLLLDPATRRKARRDLAWPTPELLERAGRRGLADPEVADLADRVFALAGEGLSGLGPARVGAGLRARFEAFQAEFVAARRDPGARPGDDLVPGSAD